jgi:hypothetical protein
VKGLRIQLLTAAAVAGLALVPSVPGAGFTHGSHTPRRRINPVQRRRPGNDPEVERWNAEVDRRKAERKGARRA